MVVTVTGAKSTVVPIMLQMDGVAGGGWSLALLHFVLSMTV